MENTENAGIKEVPIKPREIIFVKKLVQDKKTQVAAYKETHPNATLDTAYTGSSELIRRPKIQQEIARQLEVLGMSDNYTGESLKAIIDAGVANSHKAKPSDALAGLDMLNRLKDRYPATKSIQATTNLDKQQQNLSITELKAQLEVQQQETRRLMSMIENQEKL